MSLKRVFLSVAAVALLLTLAQDASAQTRLRLRANNIFPADGGRIAGNSNYDERDGVPRKIEVQVQNVRAATTWMDAYIYYPDTGDFVYFASLPLVNGVGRVEHEIEFGQFVPDVRLNDFILLFDSVTYDWMGYGFYEIDN